MMEITGMTVEKPSNSFSDGGGGVHFEAHVQASFVTLMLTGGYAPCFPGWPIIEIRLQGKIDGFQTDDLIVFVQDEKSNNKRKALCQIKYSIAITKGNTYFGKVIKAAWNDFNHPGNVVKGKDIIALITGPLSAIDTRNVHWLLNQARCTKDIDEYLRRVKLARYGPSKRAEKLEAIKHHLKVANGGNDVSPDELYEFLNHFHLLSYDLGNESGVVLSLLHSHISQFQQQTPQWAWARIAEFVQTCNQNAGAITPDKLPDDLREAFKRRAEKKIPKEFEEVGDNPETDWAQHSDATYLALATLIGAWEDNSEGDIEAIKQFSGNSCKDWQNKAREVLHRSDSPLSHENDRWKVVNRTELWNQLGSRIFGEHLNKFKSLAVSVLKEPDPAFELPVEKRYAARIYGKTPKHSHSLRKGIAEGLVILGSQPGVCSNCSQGEVQRMCTLAIHELLTDADGVLWGSLNDLLPTLAEVAPDKFLGAVEEALLLTPCPFDELFPQEGGDILTSRNYLTGLLWALEVLAWDEEHLVRVCVALGELASRFPDSGHTNYPFNSLVTILLPWFPQTLASVEKRNVALETIFNGCPDIAWNLLLQFLPNQHRTSSGSCRPSWRKTIPDDWEEDITKQEYQQQISFYAELAVDHAEHDSVRLSALIDCFNNLPEPGFDKLLKALVSQPVLNLPEKQRLPIWNHLTRFTNKHREASGAEWALPDEDLTRIEKVAKQIAPTNPFNLYQNLFSEGQREQPDERKEKAIREIFQKNGIKGVIRFAEAVSLPGQAGNALGAINSSVIEETLLPDFLDTPDNKHRALAAEFVYRCYDLKGWAWCDGIDKSDWTPEQTGQFLACLPFTQKTWDRASKWLDAKENEYWTRTEANGLNEDMSIAVDKLIKHGKPQAAISCLYRMLYAKQPMDNNQCVQALLAVLSSSEPRHMMDDYYIVELVKFLQVEPSVDQDDLFKIEWAYIPLLNKEADAPPQLLRSRLANDPEFFCEIIRLIYKSEKENEPSRASAKNSKEMAENAWRLLREWNTPPGTQKDETFNGEHFTEWLRTVKASCAESGHLEVALIKIGEVLIHAPPDPDGLWIHRAVAAALNDRKAEDMRAGFGTGTFNSRGVRVVDPSGEAERKLAEQFQSKADEIENAGFQRLATALKELRDIYNEEAIRTRSSP